MSLRYVVVDNCPVPRGIARKVRALKHDVPSARLNSCYRGAGAKRLLHRLGKRTQSELYYGWVHRLPGFYPANPPGYSSHELRSDGSSFYGPRGRRIPRWKVGMDWNDADIQPLMRAAERRGWKLVRPYSSGSEYHHVSFSHRPRWRRNR